MWISLAPSLPFLTICLKRLKNLYVILWRRERLPTCQTGKILGWFPKKKRFTRSHIQCLYVCSSLTLFEPDSLFQASMMEYSNLPKISTSLMKTILWANERDHCQYLHWQKAAIWTQLLLDTWGSTWHKGILNVTAKRNNVIRRPALY